MQMSQEIDKLAEALSKAQGEMKAAKKESNNPFFKTRYADLNDCWDAIRDPLSKNGLSVIQLIEQKEGVSVLVTMLAHSSGQWIKSETLILTKEASPQAYGSAISYSRRYGLCAIVGLTASEDEDDGERAQGRSASSVAPVAFVPNGTELASEKQVALINNLCKHSEKEYVSALLDGKGYSDIDSIKKKDASDIITALQAHLNTKQQRAS